MASSNLGRCVFCNMDLSNRDRVVFCALCGRPHHHDCWMEIRSCSTHGCGGTNYNSHRRHIQFGKRSSNNNTGRNYLDLTASGGNRSATRTRNIRSAPPRSNTTRPRQPPPPPPPPQNGYISYDTYGGRNDADPCEQFCGCLVISLGVSTCLGTPTLCAFC